MSFAGRYVYVSDEHFLEYLKKEGFDVSNLKDGKINDVFEIKVNGKIVTITHIFGELPPRTQDYIIDETIEEGFKDLVMKSTTTLSGNDLTIVSMYPDGFARTKIFRFTDTGLITYHKSPVNGDSSVTFKKE